MKIFDFSLDSYPRAYTNFATDFEIQRLNTIRQLQSLDFSLYEIKELYEEGAQAPSVEQLNEKIEKTERQLQLLVARRSQLVNWVNAHKKN